MGSHDASDRSSAGSVISHQHYFTVVKHEIAVLMQFEHIAVLRLKLSESCRWASCMQDPFSIPQQSASACSYLLSHMHTHTYLRNFPLCMYLSLSRSPHKVRFYMQCQRFVAKQLPSFERHIPSPSTAEQNPVQLCTLHY